MDPDYDGKVTYEEFCTFNFDKQMTLAQQRAHLRKLHHKDNGYIDEFEFTQNFVDK